MNPQAMHPDWSLDRSQLEQLQLEKLNQLFEQILPANPFYREKLGTKNLQLSSLAELATLPLTTKDQLVEASDHQRSTFPAEEYVRYHQTSGTRGRPMAVCDTAEDWRWWMRVWDHVLTAAEIGPQSRAMLAFSFGPFIGFWSAFDALVARQAQAIPGGGMSSAARLELIQRTEADALFCTPSYALRLAEVGNELGIDVASLPIQTLVVAGEPGGSLPATRTRIEHVWGARVIDHSGATEIGPWGFGDDLWCDLPGLRIVESEFVAEFLALDSEEVARPGQLARLVLTPLGRIGMPVVRYLTGDLVRYELTEDGPCRFVRLVGGIVGREDDMLLVRGVNIFPSSIEQVLSGFSEVVEHRLLVTKQREMNELVVEVEDRLNEPQRIANELQLRLGLSIEVRCLEVGSLPRTEGGKSRRVEWRE